MGRGDQRKPEYLAINPLGKVPALQVGARAVSGGLSDVSSQSAQAMTHLSHPQASRPCHLVASAALPRHSLNQTQTLSNACPHPHPAKQDGGFLLAESSAILRYLCETRLGPSGSPWWPGALSCLCCPQGRACARCMQLRMQGPSLPLPLPHATHAHAPYPAAAAGDARGRARIGAALDWHASTLRIGSMLTVWNRAIVLR